MNIHYMQSFLPDVDFACLEFKSILIRISTTYKEGKRVRAVKIAINGSTFTLYNSQEQVSRSELFTAILVTIGYPDAYPYCRRRQSHSRYTHDISLSVPKPRV